MTISNSHASYVDCYELMDRAVEEPRGVRMTVESHDAATFFRMRLHQARKLDRERSRDVYEPGDPKYNTSVYDPLVIRIRNEEGKFYLYVEQVTAGLGIIESLPELGEWEPLPQPEPALSIPSPQPALQIEHFKRRL